MTEKEKQRFYESAARRFKAELKLSGATAAIHIENKNDEVFWGKVLRHVCPKGRFRFISSSRSASGNITCGCTQCLQYLDYLDERFWIAIDSDYRYLKEEKYMNVRNYILQTYTYSFENHFCYGPNLNLALQKAVSPGTFDFDFVKFLKEYSNIIYPLMVWMFYLESIDPEAFPKNVFHRLLSFNRFSAKFYENNGRGILDVLGTRTRKFLKNLKKEYPEADTAWYEARCNELGVTRENTYLFVRGHNLYDMLIYMGRKMVSAARSSVSNIQREHGFEYFLLSNLCFGKYKELNKIEEDVRYLLKT